MVNHTARDAVELISRKSKQNRTPIYEEALAWRLRDLSTR
jgi:hypothetical protein